MPQPVRPISLPPMVPGWLPARGGDNTPLLFFMTRTQKATIRGKKVELLWGPWRLCWILSSTIFWCVVRIEIKAQVLLTAALSHAWIRSTYFHTVSMVQWKWSLGMEVLFAQTIARSVQKWGHWRHGDNKSPSLSYPICGNTKKKQWRMSPIAASNGIIRNIQPHVTQSHLWISQMKLSPSESLSLSLVLSRRVSSNYRPRSPLSWGFFYPIKFYYKD